MSKPPTRRAVLQAAALPALASAKVEPTLSQAGVYTRLGLRPLINAMGTVTILGGSIMPPEVVRAMEEASKFFIDLPELQKKAGERIAELVGVPAAMITAGAASAITVATEACVTRGDHARYAKLPDTAGMPDEVIQQKSHHSGYEAQMRLVGARIVEVETREELERAIGERTAMMFYMNRADADGRIGRKEWIEIAKARGIPTLNDAAADVPPRARLSGIVAEGFDLVAFSGGKGMRGPQSTGLLLGRKDLIEGATPAISPQGGIGRGMKVGKEEIAGLLAAVERFVRADHEAEWRVYETRVADIIRTVDGVPGLKAERHVPRIANEVPHVSLSWNEAERSLTSQEVVKQLRAGEPPIAVLNTGAGQLLISVWTLQGNEHRTVARRLREVLRA